MSLFRRDRGSGDRWIVVGLGNPGPRYERTRHNIGVVVLESLREQVGGKLKAHKSGCLVVEGRLSGEQVVLARSTSFMNESGGPVGRLVRYYKSPLERVVVVYDEIDLPFGTVRVKIGGGSAGHNGVKSLCAHLGKDFVRVRVGVSRPRGNIDAADYVLSEFSGSERKDLPDLVQSAAEAVEAVLEHGVERAMNEVNAR